MSATSSDHVKIIFRLQRDEEGYPPVDEESLWAVPVGKRRFKIDNIPFFVVGISADDIVEADKRDAGYYFQRVVVPSGHSTIRVLCMDASNVGDLRKKLEELGCTSEGSHLPRLFAVDVPPEAPWSNVIAFLKETEESGLIEYEEGALRHVKKGEWWKLW